MYFEDEADSRILECAIIAEADVIISGDRQLLALRNFERNLHPKTVRFLEKVKPMINGSSILAIRGVCYF